MQDKNITTNPVVPDPIAAATAMAGRAMQGDFVKKIVDKIKASENILIALSKDPSVDDLAAAIGLAMFLDGMQKHATAIYSGKTPAAIKFLQPDATFETNTDSLRDFIIALNKEKADHLRYKLEGDFVKVFITPYKTTISEKDLSFSHGDYNVDFVIAINVASAGNLDEALKEHGRIMHDASVVNITTGAPGRFGEIEWSDPGASSICEMMTNLIMAIQGDDKPLERDVATALLTGIVAATDRFSNERTNSDTMGVASKLMSMGADQQLITSNVKGNEVVHNEPGAAGAEVPTSALAGKAQDKTNLEVKHEEADAGGVKTEAVGTGNMASANATGAAGASTAGATPATGAGENPAVKAAPSADDSAKAETIPNITATNSVKPESVVVEPVIPGANSGATGVASGTSVGAGAPKIVSASSMPNRPEDGATGESRPMAMSAPDDSGIPQKGNDLQPPVPKGEKKKNFAEMMEEALAEPVPMPANPNLVGLPVVPADQNAAMAGAASVNPIMNNGAMAGAPGMAVPMTPGQVGVVNNMTTSPVMGLPGQAPVMAQPGMMQAGVVAPGAVPAAGTANVGVAPVTAEVVSGAPVVGASPVMTVPGTTVPLMEPVANPNTGIIPPPPTPLAGTDMMPPVLPPVQM